MCASVLDIVYSWNFFFFILTKRYNLIRWTSTFFLHIGVQSYNSANHSTNQREAMQSVLSKF